MSGSLHQLRKGPFRNLLGTKFCAPGVLVLYCVFICFHGNDISILTTIPPDWAGCGDPPHR